MKQILDDYISDQNINLKQYRFRGKLAGKKWKHEQAVDRINIARKIIFLMSILVFYPVLRYYLDFGVFDLIWFIERLIYSIVFLLCGIFFEKFRLASMIIAMIPILFILFSYLFFIEYFPLRIIAFNLAIMFLIGMGIYFHFQEKKLTKFLIQKIKERDQEVEIVE